MDSEVVGFMTFFICCAVVAYFIIKARIIRYELVHKERMALIEKGQFDVQLDFESMRKPRTSRINLPRYLALGLFLIGIGIAFLGAYYYMPDPFEAAGMAIAGFFLLSPGLMLLLFYAYMSKKEKMKEQSETSEE